MEPNLITQLEDLANRGVKLNRTEVWVLTQCFDTAKSMNELAKEKNLTYHSVYKAVRKLEDLKMVHSVFQLGREHFYRSNFDVSETADFTMRVKLYKRSLTFPEFMGYLQSDVNRMKNEQAVIIMLLSHVYRRSQMRADGVEKLPNPTGPEVKLALQNIIKDFEEFTASLRSISEMPLFDASDKIHEMMGELPEGTEEFFKLAAAKLSVNWNNVITTRGFKDPVENIKQEGIDTLNAWTPSE